MVYYSHAHERRDTALRTAIRACHANQVAFLRGATGASTTGLLANLLATIDPRSVDAATNSPAGV
ncbi:hypothetical protein [Embleya sp. NBC_00896]|uniref:hypothetical protein n=1 Tax=Embleya sp. NBC_00896 TaxID=2975961 RepID=UPI00386B0BC9|nr:hypothetical protein OG928_15430 [Embleya sp. NBC_00896]